MTPRVEHAKIAGGVQATKRKRRTVSVSLIKQAESRTVIKVAVIFPLQNHLCACSRHFALTRRGQSCNCTSVPRTAKSNQAAHRVYYALFVFALTGVSCCLPDLDTASKTTFSLALHKQLSGVSVRDLLTKVPS